MLLLSYWILVTVSLMMTLPGFSVVPASMASISVTVSCLPVTLPCASLVGVDSTPRRAFWFGFSVGMPVVGIGIHLSFNSGTKRASLSNDSLAFQSAVVVGVDVGTGGTKVPIIVP